MDNLIPSVGLAIGLMVGLLFAWILAQWFPGYPATYAFLVFICSALGGFVTCLCRGSRELLTD